MDEREMERLAEEKQPPETGQGFQTRNVSHDVAEHYQTVRGVTFPIEPGSSRLRIEIDRRRALRRMKMDDRTLERFAAMQKRGDLT